MDDIVDQIKNKIDIVDFIGSYIQVKKAGRNFKAICPFHQEKSPSFVISPDRQIWHCFGACGDGGDCIKFLMKWDNLTFYEALKELGDKVGIQVQKVSFQDKAWDTKELILKINALTAEYYQYILQKTPFGKAALDYLASRGIPQTLAHTFQLGYSPSSWDSLLKFLTKKGYTNAQLYDAGVVVKSEAGRYYDRFRGRLMFPIKDIRGNVIGFSGRVLDKTSKDAKYMNTPETAIYHKRESLFGIHLAKEAIRKEGKALIVEGEFDMISPYQHGIENVVAVKGSALTKEQLTILKRLTTKLIFAFDGDGAGREAIKKALREAELMDFELYVLSLTDQKDPDEAVRNDLLGFKKKLKSPVSVYDFIIDSAVEKNTDSSAFSKKTITQEVVPFIAHITNPVIQSHYLKKVAKLLEVSEDSVQMLCKKYMQTGKVVSPFTSRPVQQKERNRQEILQKYILAYMFQNDKPYEILKKVLEVLEPVDFSIPAYEKIVSQLVEYSAKGNPGNLNEFCNSLPAELQSTCNELFLFNIEELQQTVSDEKTKDAVIGKSVIDLRIASLKKRLAAATKDEESEEKEKMLTLLAASLKEVAKKANSLYNYTI